MQKKRPWTQEQIQKVTALYKAGNTYYEIGQKIKPQRSGEQVRWLVRTLRANGEWGVEESPFPRYDEPLVMEGDALVLPDIEAPYHHAEFINRCIDLAHSWGIYQAIVAGDLLHFSSLSSWGAEFVEESNNGHSKAMEVLEELASKVSKSQRRHILAQMDQLEKETLDPSPSYSSEMKIARKLVRQLSDAFEEIHFVLGNHEVRFIRAIQSSAYPQELLINLQAEEPKWKIAPYFYSYLISNGEKFIAEHPATAAKYAPIYLANKYEAHILMAHSHAWTLSKNASGRYWAIQMGCCVDEKRLPYASQRHNTKDAHRLGAVIVRNGYPWLLGEETDWEALARLGG